MGITVGTRKRQVDISSYFKPSILYHGKAWFDLSDDILKFWDEAEDIWITEDELTLVTYSAGLDAQM
jgi:hypothetical protein